MARSLDWQVHDSGGRYRLALDLAPDLPPDLLRYDSSNDPYRDMYRGGPLSNIPEVSEGTGLTSSTHRRRPWQVHSSSGSAPSERPSTSLGNSTSLSGKLARGLKNLFVSPDRRSMQHGYEHNDSPSPLPASLTPPPLPPKQPYTTSDLFADAQPPFPPLQPPPVTPHLEDSPEVMHVPRVFAQIPLNPPTPPVPAMPSGLELDPGSESPHWTLNTDSDDPVVTTPPMDTPGPLLVQPELEPEHTPTMSRLEQWAQTLKGQRFEEEEGMLGPYETNSVIMPPSIPSTLPPLDTSLSTEKKHKEKKEKRRERSQSEKTRNSPSSAREHSRSKSDKPISAIDSPKTLTDSEESGSKPKSRSKTKEKSSKNSTPTKSESDSKTASKSRTRTLNDEIVLNEARSLPSHPSSRQTRDMSFSQSDMPGTYASTAHAETLARLETYAGVASEDTKFSKDTKPRPRTYETDQTQSTASFGHLLHSNGRPVPINMQTQAGLLPQVGNARRIHRRNHSHSTPLGDIYEHSEPQPSDVSHRSLPPLSLPATSMPGEASKYYAQVETVSDVDDKFPSFSTHHSVPQASEYMSHQPIDAGGMASLLQQVGYGHTAPLDQLTPSPYGHQEMMTPSYLPTMAAPTLSPTPTPFTAHHAEWIISPVHSPAPPSSYAPSLPEAPSVGARTVATANVPQMVQHSSFHDETLCQLLDASRLNLLGDEAKKALMRAARARVVELKDIREKTKEMEKGVTPTQPLVIKKKEKEREKEKEKSKGKNHGQRKRGKHPESDSKSDTVRNVDAKSNVEELLESLLEKQEVDRATREHVCNDPANHSRCMSSDDDFEKVEEDLYGRRLTPSPQRNETPQYDVRGIYPPVPYPAGYQYPGPYMPGAQPYPVSVPIVHAASVYQPYPPPPHPLPQPPQPTATNVSKERSPSGVPESESTLSLGPSSSTFERTYRAGAQSRDSHELMAEVLNINYAGVPVKQILEDFIRERHKLSKSGSIHTVPTTPGASDTQSVPQKSATPLQSRHVSNPSVKAPFTRPPSSRHSHVDVPSPRSHRHVAAPPTAHTEKDSESKRSTSADWAWGPNIKIRVQPPTTLTNTTSVSTPTHEAPVEHSRSASSPPAPSTRSSRTAMDPTASYLPLDLNAPLPALPPSTYAPSVPDTVSEQPMVPPFKASPWDLVAHRLYSWALVWEDDYFSKALESISIGRPVDEFSLTVMTMMMFKRILQLRLTAEPPQPCDKLFVPPNIAEAINKAVHAKEYDTAQALLEALWYAFGHVEPPRVIISLVRHGAIKDAWIANRYDLVTHRFTTYIVCNAMPTEKDWDGRPFMWWHAIRQTWRQYNIPNPIALTQVIKAVTVPTEFTEDISLRAASIARNLLLGIRPEHDHDIPKLRRQTWTEVNRLHTKKRAGKLLVHREM